MSQTTPQTQKYVFTSPRPGVHTSLIKPPSNNVIVPDHRKDYEIVTKFDVPVTEDPLSVWYIRFSMFFGLNLLDCWEFAIFTAAYALLLFVLPLWFFLYLFTNVSLSGLIRSCCGNLVDSILNTTSLTFGLCLVALVVIMKQTTASNKTTPKPQQTPNKNADNKINHKEVPKM